MAYIIEEIGSPLDGISMRVLQKDDETRWRANEIIDIEFDTMKSFTPGELKKLGKWLIGEADRIGKQYGPTGKRKLPLLNPVNNKPQITMKNAILILAVMFLLFSCSNTSPDDVDGRSIPPPAPEKVKADTAKAVQQVKE